MHPVINIMHWSHHLHDILLTLRYHVSDHLHSRHFWAGMGVALLIVGIMTLLFILARNAPIIYPRAPPYIPYGL